MPDQNPPSSADDALIRILRELGQLRTDFSSFRDQGERRYMLLVNELAEVRVEARRATEIASEAKRQADAAAHEMHDTQRAVIEHTRGLATTQATQTKQIAELITETGGQTASIAALLAAETERKTREDERKKVEDSRWTSVARWWPILLAVVAAASYAAGHWKP